MSNLWKVKTHQMFRKESGGPSRSAVTAPSQAFSRVQPSGLTNAVLPSPVAPLSNLAAPPAGLPGFTSKAADPDVMRLLQLGAEYAAAVARGEKRTLWNIHQQMRRALNERSEEGRAEGRKERLPTTAYSYSRPESVYFIRAGEGPIKIGVAADVDARVRHLQTAQAEPLVVLAVTGGGQKQEFAYHQRFAGYRLHGEWFSPHPEILAEVNSLNERSPCVRPLFNAAGAP